MNNIILLVIYIPQGTQAPLLTYRPVFKLLQSKQFDGSVHAKQGEIHRIQ